MDAIEARIMIDSTLFDNIVEQLQAEPNMKMFAEDLLQYQSKINCLFAWLQHLDRPYLGEI